MAWSWYVNKPNWASGPSFQWQSDAELLDAGTGKTMLLGRSGFSQLTKGHNWQLGSRSRRSRHSEDGCNAAPAGPCRSTCPAVFRLHAAGGRQFRQERALSVQRTSTPTSSPATRRGVTCSSSCATARTSPVVYRRPKSPRKGTSSSCSPRPRRRRHPREHQAHQLPRPVPPSRRCDNARVGDERRCDGGCVDGEHQDLTWPTRPTRSASTTASDRAVPVRG